MGAIRHVFLDLEGTLIKDKAYQPIQGAVGWFNRQREGGLGTLVVSNNTTHAPREIEHRLREVGFGIGEGEVLTCVGVGVEMLRAWGVKACLVVGEDSLAQILAAQGFTVDGEGRVDAVVVGLDRRLTYARLSQAVEALLRFKIPLLALHYNRLYLDVDGARGPSVGAIVRSLEYACGVEAEVAGKPSEAYYENALRRASARAGEVLFVSDDPLSDLVGAKRVGMRTAFVLSGKYPSEDVLGSIESGMRPDLVVSSVVDIEVNP